MDVAFLIGSPRSGTTILENILNCHASIAELYEPYYLWERHFNADDSDVWDQKDLTPGSMTAIRREFAIFSRKSRKPVVLDKSPLHVYNIPIIQKIFPMARWIHLVRDGRDVTLSINREWEKRKRQVIERDYLSLFRTAATMLGRQPLLRFRLLAVLHELSGVASMHPRHYLNKSRWQGNPGWGPRFSGWQRYLDENSLIRFNAMQWASCVAAARTFRGEVLPEQWIEIKYEDLLTAPEKALSRILFFLGCTVSDTFFDTTPALVPDNFNKWKKQMTQVQLNEIEPVVNPMLEAYGYVS
jgi:hypothetical protein